MMDFKSAFQVRFQVNVFYLLLCLMMMNGVKEAQAQAGAAAAQQPQRVNVSGVVTDAAGEPLIGATVLVKGATTGTATDINGKFSIYARPGDVLKVSYVGYAAKTVAVGSNVALNIVLDEDEKTLGEVVVVGYGTQRRINLSGSVDQVSAKQLEARPMTSISGGLQGMVPNLNIDFSSGEPGRAASINIRGVTSINGGSPLVLIDGVPSDGEELNRLQPEDIESISILKDAASAAIYGARAAFGIILITTKQGTTENVQVSYNNNFSWKRPSVLPEKTSDPYIYLKLKNIAVLNTPWSAGHVTSDEKLEWARQKSDNPQSTPSVRLNPLDETQWEYMGDRDWTKYFLDKSTFSNAHQVSVSGAAEKVKFYLSGGYNGENGILSDVVKDDSYTRYNFRGKASYSIKDIFTLSNNTSFASTKRLKPSYLGDMSIFYDIAPNDYDVNPDGTWANSAAGLTMAQLADGGRETTEYSCFQSTFSGELKLFGDDLKANANFTFSSGGEDYSWYKNKYRIGYGPQDVRELGDSRAYKHRTVENHNILELYATYSKSFARHFVTGIVGFNQEYSKWDKFTSEREGIISTSLPTVALAFGEPKVDEEYTDWAVRGMFYRANYIYDNRYIVELNGRYDGTSRFPKSKRFGFFPSASLAWRINSESFFEPVRPVVSQLKLRASYGSLGNQLVSEYGYVSTMESSPAGYIIGGQIPQKVSSPSLVSSDYSWEKVYTQNFGVDAGFLGQRLTANFDIYRRDTKDMLIKGKELPAVLGTAEPKENAGDMKTTGWELSLSYADRVNLAGRPLSWSAKLTLSDSRSWITRYDNPTGILTDYYEGMEFGEIWGLQSDGLFRSADEIAKLDESDIIPWNALEIVPGWPKYKDLNTDARITKGDVTLENHGDLSIIGNSASRYRFGVNLAAEWSGVDVSVFLQGVGKRDYYPLSFLYWGFYQQPYAGGVEHIYDFYRPESDSQTDREKHSQAYIRAGLADQNLDALYPAFQCWLADKNLGTGVADAMGTAIPQTQYMLNGAYLRVKNITVGYTLPPSAVRRIGLSRIRIYASGDNIYEWSELKKYFDPEAITDSGQHGYVYPFSRQYSFGVNVTF
jgi:TonB-linked SusC/RagA family outer membrane protein